MNDPTWFPNLAAWTEHVDFKLWTQELDDACRLAWMAFEVFLAEGEQA
jgi:hypothetical protein